MLSWLKWRKRSEKKKMPAVGETSGEAKYAKEEAVAAVQDAISRKPEVDRVTFLLQKRHEDNHFRDGWLTPWGRGI